MRRVACCVFLLLLSGSAEARQQPAAECPTPAVTYQDHWCRPIKAIRKLVLSGQTGQEAEIERLVRLQGANLAAFLLYAQSRAQSVDVRTLEDVRTDKHVGAPGNAVGSTSAVSKGAVPSVLGFAVENGALAQSVVGTTVTLRGNLVGWLDLVQNQGFIAAYQDDSGVVRALRRVSYSFTLDTSTGLAASEEANGGGLNPLRQLETIGQQLVGFSVRAALWDQRDPRNASNRAAVASLADAMTAAQQANNFLNVVFDSQEYNFGWIPETASQLANPALSEKALERVLYRQLEAIRLEMVRRIDDFDNQVTRALMALQGFDKARLRVFEAMRKRPLAAFEYVNARAEDAPDRSTLRFIYERQWGPRIDLTGNVAVTLQRSGVAAESTENLDWRDAQAAVQLDIPLTSAERTLQSLGGIGTPVVAIAYLAQNLSERATVSFAGASVPLEPGWVHAVQARLTIPVKGSGIKIPLSISFSNRTELITEKTVRGHLGMTFDLDVLSALRR